MRISKFYGILAVLCVIIGLQACGSSDKTITQNVQASLAAEKSLAGEKIDVATNDGVVTLTGTVSTSNQIQTASRLTQTVVGVKSVDNKLTVKPMQVAPATGVQPSVLPQTAPQAPAAAVQPAAQVPGQTTQPAPAPTQPSAGTPAP